MHSNTDKAHPALGIDTIPVTLQSWVVCFTAALFFFYEFIQMNMFNTVSADLMRDFAINATQLGRLSAIYFYANLAFLLVAGALLDRFSTRKIIIITLLCCAVGIGIFALSHHLWLAGIARFLSGIGSAFCFLSGMRLASRWFPSQRMALVTGLIVTMAMIGGMVAQAPLTYLVEKLGWRQSLLLDSALGFLITFIISMVVRDYPPNYQAQHNSIRAQLKNIGSIRSWLRAYLNPQNWLAALYTSLLNLPLALLGAIWGSLYLVQVQHLTRLQASYVTTMLFVGTIIGGPLAGWVSDYIQRRKRLMIIGGVLSLLIIYIIMHTYQASLTLYLFLFFALGLVTSTQVLSYPLVAESNSRALTATSISVVSFCAIGGYAVFQPLFGMVMDRYWSGTMVDQLRWYGPGSYHHALSIIPLGFIIGLLAICFTRETYCQYREDSNDV